MNAEQHYLDSARKQFSYYQLLGEKTMEQLTDDQLSWQYNAESNSMDMIVNHLHGNMLSRWTDFLTTDGEKEWRKRDAEFEAAVPDRLETMRRWKEGWDCLYAALESITPENFYTTVYIRNQGHTITDAINRQLCHYAYHVGQMVFLGKMMKDAGWVSLSIPRGKSAAYNAGKFSQPKQDAHFTDEWLKGDGNEE